MNLIFIAPPSAGKGTISARLVNDNNYYHISTGDLLREEIKKGTDLGLEIKSIIDKGNFVGDDLIIEMVQNKIKSLAGSYFILDGFPRNIEQAASLNDIFTTLMIDNYIVVSLKVSKEELEKRVTGRRICPQCGSTYNIFGDEYKPKVSGICDECNSNLITRADDSIETFNKRYDTYLEVTEPIINYYSNSDKLVVIECENSSDVAYEEILKVLRRK